MRQIQIQVAGLLALIALCGCATTSNRTITLEGSLLSVERHSFVSGFIPLPFSSDGRLMAGISTVEDEIQIREVDTGQILSQFDLDWSKSFPALFSEDGESLILLGQDEDGIESFSVPVRGGEVVKLHEASVDEANPEGINYDFTMCAFSNGVVLLNDGRLVVVEGAEGTPYFDQFGAVWYRAERRWVSVGRGGEVTEHVERPSYLVEDQTVHRGSMHLVKDETTMERNGVEASVTTVWLDHDKAIILQDDDSEESVGTGTALVFAGADVFSFSFVPNRKLVAIRTYDGTAFVPYVVEPRGGGGEEP